MIRQMRITPDDFFWNAAAQAAGFFGPFWLEAYHRYLDAVQRDPCPSADKWDVERTVRVPLRHGHVDVLVRTQPEGREYCVLRFTVFPASEEPEPRQLDRWYWYGEDETETLPILGEGALLDERNRW